MTLSLFKKVIEKLESKIAHPRTVYEAILPLYYSGYVFGIAPYTWTKFKNGTYIYRTSIWSIIRGWVQMAVFLAGIIWDSTIRKYPFAESDISVKLHYFQDIVSAFLATVELFCGCIFASKLAKLFVNITEIDDSLQILPNKLPNR